jgi:hypothetical protein
MNRSDCAYLINTTPKYFYLLNLHITLLRRYAPAMSWPIYLATEEPEDPEILKLNINIIPLPKAKAGFFESREAALALLPDSIRYIFPIQEDFLLEGRPMETEIADALRILDDDSQVRSIRLMPCPGPHEFDLPYKGTHWKILDFDVDRLVFTYQATLWKRTPYQNFMKSLLHKTQHLNERQKISMAISINIAEIPEGQIILRGHQGIHLAYPRSHPHPNAVYLCPWPYRPTAVVRGTLEPWASQLAEREGCPL